MELQNERFLEDMEVDFDGFVEAKDWDNARALLESLEEQGFECSSLRRRMNIAMSV